MGVSVDNGRKLKRDQQFLCESLPPRLSFTAFLDVFVDAESEIVLELPGGDVGDEVSLMTGAIPALLVEHPAGPLELV